MALRMTAQLLGEIRDAADSDIETLEVEKTMSEGEDVPNEVECASIIRIQHHLRILRGVIDDEIEAINKAVH
jgi:hypothetical protein